ncbi:transcription initiation factor IIA subunit 1-like [Lytechinus pictus]|uniref:transcription initiation factor IIA subunit 1-like n=1 Tax=Lytechinus pictus TaxID=7653 RepID=UPI00240D65AA|nr:transcription initiation factor IIA subunit 1-like [Lytechinus pictus]
MASNSQTVHKLYKSVIDDVINNVRDAFLDEGVEENVLQDLKQIWEGKLIQSKAIDLTQPQPQHVAGKFKGQQDASRQYQIAQSSTDRQHIDQQRTQPQMVLQGAPSSQSSVSNNLSSSAVAASAALQQNMLQLQSQQQQIQNVPSYTIQQGATGGATQTFPAYQIQTQQQQGGVVGYPPIILQPGAQSNTQQSRIITPQGVVLPPGTLRVQSSGDQPSIVQVDGANDSSDDEEDDFDDDDDDDKDDDDDDDDKENDDGGGEDEEDPLNSADDVSDEDPADLFESENVVVCQYDKINRNRNKWKFTLKHGIMNLKGKDYVFNKSTGDADW